MPHSEPRVQAELRTSARGPLTAADAAPTELGLTAAGLPCLTMANSHAYVYSTDMDDWLRVADWDWPASAYHAVGTTGGGGGGEAAARMAAAEAARPRAMLLASVRAVCPALVLSCMCCRYPLTAQVWQTAPEQWPVF